MDTFKSMTKKVWETMSWGKIITFCRHNFSKQNSEIELNRAHNARNVKKWNYKSLAPK